MLDEALGQFAVYEEGMNEVALGIAELVDRIDAICHRIQVLQSGVA